MTGLIDLGRRLVAGRPERPPRRDMRAGRIIALIECVLNQNARDVGAATSPALDRDALRLCSDHAVGIVQIPCPEMRALGLGRARPSGTSIRAALDTDAGRRCCRRIGIEIADRLQDYARNGCTVLAVVGGNEHSPGCAVHNGPAGLLPSSGILMREPQDELRRRGLELPFIALRDADASALATDIDRLAGLLESTAPAAAVAGDEPR